jgi:hypothetical protein
MDNQVDNYLIAAKKFGHIEDTTVLIGLINAHLVNILDSLQRRILPDWTPPSNSKNVKTTTDMIEFLRYLSICKPPFLDNKVILF